MTLTHWSSVLTLIYCVTLCDYVVGLSVSPGVKNGVKMARVGQSTSITCRANDSETELRWQYQSYRNLWINVTAQNALGITLQDSGNIPGGQRLIMKFPSFKREAVRSYKCLGKRNSRAVSRVVRILVKEWPQYVNKNPRFRSVSSNPNNVTLFQKSEDRRQVIMKCVTNANYSCSARWTMKSGNKTVELQHSSLQYTLADERNQYDKLHQNAKMTLKSFGPSKSITLSCVPIFENDDVVEFMRFLTFNIKLYDSLVVESNPRVLYNWVGHKRNITCSYTGDATSVTWKKGNELLPKKDIYGFYNVEQKYILEVHSKKENNKNEYGTYTCNVTSPVYADSHSIRLVRMDKPQPPKVKHILKEGFVDFSVGNAYVTPNLMANEVLMIWEAGGVMVESTIFSMDGMPVRAENINPEIWNRFVFIPQNGYHQGESAVYNIGAPEEGEDSSDTANSLGPGATVAIALLVCLIALAVVDLVLYKTQKIGAFNAMKERYTACQEKESGDTQSSSDTSSSTI